MRERMHTHTRSHTHTSSLKAKASQGRGDGEVLAAIPILSPTSSSATAMKRKLAESGLKSDFARIPRKSRPSDAGQKYSIEDRLSMMAGYVVPPPGMANLLRGEVAGRDAKADGEAGTHAARDGSGVSGARTLADRTPPKKQRSAALGAAAEAIAAAQLGIRGGKLRTPKELKREAGRRKEAADRVDGSNARGKRAQLLMDSNLLLLEAADMLYKSQPSREEEAIRTLQDTVPMFKFTSRLYEKVKGYQKEAALAKCCCAIAHTRILRMQTDEIAGARAGMLRRKANGKSAKAAKKNEEELQQLLRSIGDILSAYQMWDKAIAQYPRLPFRHWAIISLEETYREARRLIRDWEQARA